MTRLQKYRLLVLVLFLASLTGLLAGTYSYIKSQVPDVIFVEEGEEIPVIFREPFCSFIEEEAVEAGSSRASDIPRDNLHLSPAEAVQETVECSLLGVIPLKTVEVERTSRPSVYVGGFPVGIYMKTKGILVIGTGELEGADGKTHEPAEHIVETGDYIIAANGVPLENKEELVECISSCKGNEIALEVLREGKCLDLSITPVKTSDQKYKAGIWVRSDAQGVGTLTYTDGKGGFGALGHGISDVDTGTLLKMQEGNLYEAEILSIKKGVKGKPGELTGIIHYQDKAILGSIRKNTGAGIYGTANEALCQECGEEYEIAYKQEIEKGPATLLCSVDGAIESYDIQVESIDMNKKEVNKGLVIRVTDPVLLEKTGGILQGMSGSPILQNGRIIGAVTHVFVQDSTKGYGIFIEEMLEA